MAFATVTKDPVAQLDVLCITAGLGRDGDPIARSPHCNDGGFATQH
jgi:hypothetical protein